MELQDKIKECIYINKNYKIPYIDIANATWYTHEYIRILFHKKLQNSSEKSISAIHKYMTNVAKRVSKKTIDKIS